MKIISVGRNYAQLDHGDVRVNLDTLQVSDSRGRESVGYGYGRCHLSRVAWEERQALERAWSNLAKVIDKTHQPPSGVTVEDIDSARRKLGLA